MVIERRKYFTKRKEKIPAAMRGDAEWRGAAWRLPCPWISDRWGVGQCILGGKLEERSRLMGSACLSPCSVVLPAKSDKWESRPKEVESKWLKGGSLV